MADDQGPVASLWARHTFQVRLKLVLDHWLGLPYVRVRDRLPYGARRTSGEEEGQAALYPGAPFSLGAQGSVGAPHPPDGNSLATP